MADEVYEHIVYAPAVHVRMATLPELAERTVTVSSGGKTFSFTGWKVGWAMAEALRLPDTYLQTLVEAYGQRRESLLEALEWAGLRPIGPEGTYFAMARINHLGHPTDLEFCRWLTTSVGVAAIPPSGSGSSVWA